MLVLSDCKKDIHQTINLIFQGKIWSREANFIIILIN